MKFQYRNFTLTEIVVVMMIFSLVVGVAVTSIRKIPAFISLEQIIFDLKRQCAEARKTASCQNRDVAIWYDPEGYIRSEEQDILLPEKLFILVGQENIRENNERCDLFVFFPDGSAQNQKLELVLDTDTITIMVSPLTGRIFTNNDKND